MKTNTVEDTEVGKENLDINQALLDKIIIHNIESFISDDEASQLIEEASKDFVKTTTLGENSDNEYRVAQGTWLYDNKNQLVAALKEKISKIINVPVENFEQLHVVKYEIGGQYKVHHDYFHANMDYFENVMKRGGQRTHSALIYLNEDFEGGETDFPKIPYRAIPKKNKLIIWKNVDENNKVEYNSLHAGLPVTKGIKYIGIFWIREGKFI
jgi:prolyl 4-hydroxylase